MMGRGGGRSLVLLCAVATLLLISSSAVSGVLDENVRDFGRFVGRLELQRSDGGVIIPVDGEKAAHVTEEPKQLESDVVVDEKKPAEGIFEKARSFLSGLTASIGNGRYNPTSFLWETKNRAGPEKVEKTVGRKGHIFGRRHRFGRSRWAGIRDLMRNHPERLAAAAATEPLALDEEAIPVTPVSELSAKIKGIFRTVIREDNAVTVEPDLASTCADALETQVKILVRSVKYALREQLCNGDVASMEEQAFCNFYNIHPTMATFQSFWMIHVNPVKVAWRQTSKTAACSSENPFSSFRDSLQEMEGLARQFSLHQPEVMDTEGKVLEDDDEHRLFHRQRREHGDRESHWWHRMFQAKAPTVKVAPVEEMHEVIDPEGKQLEHDDEHHMFYRHRREHGDHKRQWWQRMFHMKRHQMYEVIDPEGKQLEHDDEHHMFYRHRREHGDHERHWWQRMFHMKPHHFEEMHEHWEHERNGGQQMLHKHMKPHHLEERQEHGDHEHWKQRLFRMFHKHRQTRHQGFEHAHEISARDVCFHRSVKHLSRGIRHHLAIACESTTSPHVIEACKFAKEHHFLVKAWLAVKIPVWSNAAKSCGRPFEDRHAPDLGIGRVGTAERENLVDVEDRVSSEAGKTNERQLNTVPQWIARRCAKDHANRGFSKALHLRGHVIGINQGESGPRELARTHLIVLGGLPFHLRDFQDASDNSQPLEHSSSGDMLTDLQDQLAEFVKEAGLVQDAVSGEHRVLPGLKTEIMVLKPFRHHANFRISANPGVLPITEGRHFRISAMPRVVREADSEMPVISRVEDVVEDVAGDIDASAEVKLQDKTPRETAELRADM